ncbi:MAG: PAS domain S-box protein [Taibaiella sp.]|nr:PAS domain S-box protein [Taibaiella sp.]
MTYERQIIDSRINILLEVCDIVLEISRDSIITNIWGNDHDETLLHELAALKGHSLDTLLPDSIICLCKWQIEETIIKGKKTHSRYILTNGLAYDVRTLNYAEGNCILLTLEAEHTENLNSEINNKWKYAFEATGDGYWDIDVENDRMYCSPRWHEIFGYTPDEIVTIDDWTSKIYADDYSVAEGNFARHARGETPYYTADIRYCCKDGSVKWVLSNGTIVSKTADGRPRRIVGTHKDITERKKMEEQYQANLSLLLRLMNNFPSGVLVTDEQKKLLFANKAFCALYGIDKHPRDLMGTDTEASLQQDKLMYKEPEELVKRIKQILHAKKIVLKDELEMIDGRIISRDYIPLSFKNNHKGEIWKFTDVTFQKNTEKRFEQQRLFYERILNSLPASIAVFDSEGHVLYINPSVVKNDSTRAATIGKTLDEFCVLLNIADDIKTERLLFFETAKKEKRTVQWDEKLVNSKGEVSYEIRCFFPIFNNNGNLDIVIGYGLTITDRKLAEDALNTSMNAFANSFNLSGIGKALVSPGGRWLEVNDEICRLTGYTRAELLAASTNDITYVEDINNDAELISQLIKKEILSYTIDKRFVSKNRQIIAASLTVSLLWGSDGNPKYYICDIINTTAQKSLTDELHRQNDKLEATKINLINKINQLEELSHMIAHNLRGPAGNIKMMAERLIIDENDPRVANEVFTREEASQIVYESSIALNNSLNTLMELTQIKLNKNIEYDNCTVEDFVNEIIRQLHGVIYEKHANIILNLEVPVVSYPKVYLESILYNLVSNSLKYSNPAIDPEITITTSSVNGKVHLIIKDNGLGIDLDRYGDKVFKLNKIFHEGFDSKGVGLFLTKSQVESLGGSITLSSKPMKGCEFTVIL